MQQQQPATAVPAETPTKAAPLSELRDTPALSIPVALCTKEQTAVTAVSIIPGKTLRGAQTAALSAAFVDVIQAPVARPSGPTGISVAAMPDTKNHCSGVLAPKDIA